MKKVDWKTFNYWAKEHYEISRVTGSIDNCKSAFLIEQKKYPTMQYATAIVESNFSSKESEYYAVIKRFKTKELFRIHHDFPVTYVREGKVL